MSSMTPYMLFQGVLDEFGSYVVRKLEPIQFPYFGMGAGAFGIGGLGFVALNVSTSCYFC
jgi:hypothetical protein